MRTSSGGRLDNDWGLWMAEHMCIVPPTEERRARMIQKIEREKLSPKKSRKRFFLIPYSASFPSIFFFS